MISDTGKGEATLESTVEKTESNGAGEDQAAKELDAVKAELKEQQNKYLYLYAEFENYKKRTFKERSDLIKFGHENLARESLQVADNLERALTHAENHTGLVSGIKMVEQQLKDTLNKFGVVPIKTVGEKFDPEKHEAVGQEKVTGEANGQLEGTVLRELQKGYTLHGRLLRPARVVVAVK